MAVGCCCIVVVGDDQVLISETIVFLSHSVMRCVLLFLVGEGNLGARALRAKSL